MTALERKIVRYRLIDRHRELVRGSMQDLLVARRLLHFLLAGEILLDLGDVDWAVEQELDHAGVHINYSGRSYTAYARLRK